MAASPAITNNELQIDLELDALITQSRVIAKLPESIQPKLIAGLKALPREEKIKAIHTLKKEQK